MKVLSKKAKIALISTLAGAVLLSGIGLTAAWFDYRAHINFDGDVIGGTAGSFFAYGDGQPYEEDGEGNILHQPYGITKARHLYNLAWLQDIGYFETSEGGHPTFYFELGADIDMEGESALPPIGTEAHPFVGNFDGKGHTVSNLTVSNDMEDFTQTPYIVDDISDIGNPQIVGFFGVVGKLSDQSFTYNTETNVIQDTGLLNLTVKSCTAQTLIGIAGGYVNGTLDNVAVNGSNLYTKLAATSLAYTNNISDYSLVGYATASALDAMNIRSDDADIPTTENPNTAQGGDNWGGSINMRDMYTYLNTTRASASAYTFATRANQTIDIYGTIQSNTATQTGTNRGYAANWNRAYYSYLGSKAIVDGNEYASFTFGAAYQNRTTTTIGYTQYVNLYGAVKGKQGTTAGNATTNNASNTINFTASGFRIKANDSNYLSYRGSVSNQTTTANASSWYWEGKYLRTTYNTQIYYLYVNNNGALACSTTNKSEWSYSTTTKRLVTTVNNTNYYLDLNGTTWRVIADSNYYLIHSGNNYMTHSDPAVDRENVSNTNSASVPTSNGVRWYWVSGNYFSATQSGNLLYVRRSSNNVAIRNSQNNRFVASAEYGDQVTLVYNNTYYVAFSNGWTNGTTRATVSIDKVTQAAVPNYSIDIESTGGTTTFSSTQNATYDTNPTYFPLTREMDKNGNYTAKGNAGKPDAKNTGYLISGANYTDTTNDQYLWGDIRVSYFAMSNISTALDQNNYSDSKLEVVTRTCVRGDNGTYSDSDWTRISDDYNGSNTANASLRQKFPSKLHYKSDLRLNKYKSSRSQVGTSLSTGGGNIYGLHFMDAAISKTKLVNAANVIVMDGKEVDDEGESTGSVYTDYPLPQDAIDFNLKDQGFINFFAGTYYTNNNAFFSLHEITRNETTHVIEDIKEIKKIYAPASGEPSSDNPYVYSYDEDVPDDAGPLAFDVDWITHPDVISNAVYYFEIPVNSGEYALGSVDGGVGAYLMYLDIGAAIANYKEITTTEKVVTILKTSKYPKGIDFKPIVTGETWTTIDGGESAGVAIASGQADKQWSFSYATSPSSVLLVTCSGTDPPISVAFEARGVAVNKNVGGASSGMSFVPTAWYTMQMNRVGSEAFNVFTNVVTHSVSETITITGGASGDTIQLAKPVVSTGYVIESAITYQIESGPATVNANGLVTRSGAGEVVVTMTYSETKSNVDTWDSASEIETDETEGTIFVFHFVDYDDPNATVRYVYDPVTKTYTVYITAENATVIDIDTLPSSGYTVIVNDGTSTTTLTSTSQVTSINIAASA